MLKGKKFDAFTLKGQESVGIFPEYAPVFEIHHLL